MKKVKRLALFLIRLYRRFISPLKPVTCRFTPTCSKYAEEAYEKYGFFKASKLTIIRIGKCGPWHPGGYDPVP